MYLQPVAGTLAGFVAALWTVEHLYHEALTGCFDAFVEEGLDLVKFLAVHARSE